MTIGSLVSRQRPAAGAPAGALVLLHGRATSEDDLFGLLDVFDPRVRFAGACPRGPLQLPPGGFHWYVVARVGFPDPDSFRVSLDALGEWLSVLAADTGVPPERTVLGGFSQGAVMAWALAAGAGRPRCGGLLAMSGFVPTVPGWEIDPANLAGLPVAISHGSFDPVISVGFGRDARDIATAAGAEVTYLETDVPHTVDPRIVSELASWVGARP